MKYLISKGADIHAALIEYCGRTSLHEAAQWGHLEVVKYLISNGADIKAKDNSGDTPLH